jgi:hypothetical protein
MPVGSGDVASLSLSQHYLKAGGQLHASAPLPYGRNPCVPIVQEAGCRRVGVHTGVEKIVLLLMGIEPRTAHCYYPDIWCPLLCVSYGRRKFLHSLSAVVETNMWLSLCGCCGYHLWAMSLVCGSLLQDWKCSSFYRVINHRSVIVEEGTWQFDTIKTRIFL